MTSLPEDAVTDLYRLVAEMEQRLESGFAAHDQTIAQRDAIAAENARLRDELSISQARQSATSDILRVISQSPADVQPVFDAIVQTAVRLLGCDMVAVLRCDGATFSPAAVATPEGYLANRTVTDVPIDPDANFPSRAIVDKKMLHLPDYSRIDLPEHERRIQAITGINSALFLPLLRDDECIGVLALTAKQPRTFGESEIALAESFRDQALVAIENARLFNETQEALAQQTATSDILRVISQSPADVQPVFDAIVQTAVRLLGCDVVAVLRRDGSTFSPAAEATPEGLTANTTARDVPIDPDANFPSRAIVRKKMVHLPDYSRIGLPEHERRIQAAIGVQSALFLPLLRDDECIGVLALTGKQPRAFSKSEIALAESFRDQALVAIENVRLFNETREALERQTATADILKVIASSPSDVQPVFEAIATSANRLLGGFSTTVFRFVDGLMYLKAFTPTSPAADELLQGLFPRPFAEFPIFELVHHGEATQIADTEALTGVTPVLRDLARSRGFRSMLFTPLMSNRETIGMIGTTRVEPGPFVPHHVQLLQTFADQAVIAIENVRLFDEVQARTRDLSEALTYQTGSGNILKVIASSPTDVEPVLKAIVDSACELCEANDAVVHLRDGDDLHSRAHHGTVPFGYEKRPIDRNFVTGRSVLDKLPIHLHDILSAEGAEYPEGQQMSHASGTRTILCVPLLRDHESIGTIVLRRTEVNPFSEKQIALLQTFADQAVIAIGNVRLFEQVQARTRELAASLDNLRTAQDRLIQTEKLASLGQLTAGIAHEIKNPLNFVNNFAALSAELTDELNDVLKPAELAGNIRQEVDELTGLLKDNLEKVVQHGKRADSIVKNMLLHSREGSGDHRPADINALLDESLNLAYHGARAEKPQFNVTLQRNFDPNAGMIELFPQEITRVFLNLISNGFYAVSKRRLENGTDFEPVVSATTADRGDHVEIRIRDNGTGIPPEVREKMFNPFFTTKPAGEGTGLGLSMSHDIIVKQHGGTIDVETEPGHFTEFRIVLPRTSQFSGKIRGQP